jgi:predicted NodU family carbamoyl transferase
MGDLTDRRYVAGLPRTFTQGKLCALVPVGELEALVDVVKDEDPSKAALLEANTHLCERFNALVIQKQQAEADGNRAQRAVQERDAEIRKLLKAVKELEDLIAQKRELEAKPNQSQQAAARFRSMSWKRP